MRSKLTMPSNHGLESKHEILFRVKNSLMRSVLCECIATAFFMLLGFSLTAQTVLSGNQMNSNLGHSIGWGLSLTFAAQMTFKLTGSHLNPAVSFFMWSFGRLKFANFLLYSLAQTIGAFIGAAITFSLYYEKITEFDGGIRSVTGPNKTASIFVTTPGDHLSIYGAIYDQVVCTAVLCIMIGVITDKNNGIPIWAQPIMMGGMLTTIQLGFSLNAQNAMNPARFKLPYLYASRWQFTEYLYLSLNLH